MSITANDTQRTVREAISDLAGARYPGETIKAMLYRAAAGSGLTASRLKSLWYGEVLSPAWHEVESLRSKAKERREARARIRDKQVAAEIALIRARLERLERDEDGPALLGEDPTRLLDVESAHMD